MTYLPSTGRFLVVDCNIDELRTYDGLNKWEITPSGTQAATGRTTKYTKEPTGVAFDAGRGRRYVSDDDKRRVLTVKAGKDGRFGTSDDTATSFSTSSFGSRDPEDVTFDPISGDLYLIDGVGRRVYKVSSARKSPASFDVGRYGAGDPEGIVYDATRKSLFVLDHLRAGHRRRPQEPDRRRRSEGDDACGAHDRPGEHGQQDELLDRRPGPQQPREGPSP